MDNSVYITLSRQLALFRDLDVTANNIANANTTGFRTENMLFTDYLVDDGNNHKMAFARDIATYADTQEGPLRATGNPLDLAINGKGFFVVETGRGVRYTRAGNFNLDGEGTLITPDGSPVLDDAGQRILLPPGASKITVGENGSLVVDGEEIAVLGIVQFPNEQEPEHEAGGVFRSKNGAPGQAVTGFRVAQGVLEDSNVSPIIQMTHMIDVNRSVGNTAKFIEVMYDLQRRASNTITQQQ